MIETLLTGRLKTLTPNVYPNVAPQNYKTPCIVYQVLDTETLTDLDGSNLDQSFVTVMLAISAPVYRDAKLLARSTKASLITWAESGVEAVSWINEHAKADDSSETTLHRVELFFKFSVDDTAS